MKFRLKPALMILALVWLPPCASDQALVGGLAHASGQPFLLLTLNEQDHTPNVRKDIGFEPDPKGVRFEAKAEKMPGSAPEAPEGARTRKVITKQAPERHSGMGAPVAIVPRPPAADGSSIGPGR